MRHRPRTCCRDGLAATSANVTPIAEITDNGWMSAWSALVVVLSLAINSYWQNKRANDDREQKRKDRLLDAQLAHLHTEEIKQAGQERMETIVAEVVQNRRAIHQLTEFRGQLNVAGKIHSGSEKIERLTLPGFDYETFHLSEGAHVQWRQEYTDTGRLVRFTLSDTGQSNMSFHWHPETREIITVIRGTLTLELANKLVTLHHGQSLETAAGDVHAAYLQGDHGAEVLCFWPDLAADVLQVGIFP